MAGYSCNPGPGEVETGLLGLAGLAIWFHQRALGLRRTTSKEANVPEDDS